MAIHHTRKLWRGQDRGRLRKLERALNMLIDRDFRMVRDAIPDKTVAFFFIEDTDTALNNAVNRVLARVQTCLDAKL